MSSSKQSISNSKANGAIRQKTDAAKADQSVSEASADSIDQTVSGQQALASRPLAPTWFPIAGAGFCVVTILFLMYLLLGPPLEAGKKTTFDVLMAFCASASAGFLGGSAVAKGQIPFFDKSPIIFSAVGGIGTFVVVFLILHYAQ